MKDPYLRAEANIDRSRVSFFSAMLAFSKGRIEIHKESLVYQSNEEIFMKVEELIQKHYKESKGKLPVFGKIRNYLYDHTDGNTYRFSVEGELLDETESKKKNQT